MKGNCYLRSYLDPIAKVWGSVQPVLPSRQAKLGVKKAAQKDKEIGYQDALFFTYIY